MRLAAKSSETFVVAAAVASLVAAIAFRDFTVDDALVAVRYARNLAHGLGWRFNHGGPRSDGVTPLPLPLLLAPLATGGIDALAVFGRVRVLMGAAHAGMVAVLITAIARRKPSPLVATVVVVTLLLSFPLAAYATCGMETPLAGLLATAAAVSPRSPRRAALLAGLAATLRPELAPWAVVVGFGYGVERADGAIRLPLAALLLGVGPTLLCVLARVVVFGSPAPLALQAKPSDVMTGARYVLAALLTTTSPLLLLAPRAIARAGRVPLTLVTAFAVHAIVVMLVGGDWMPFARLFAPVLPSLLFAFVVAAPFCDSRWMIARAGAAFALAIAALATSPPELRRLWPQRLALAREATPLLMDAGTIATLDIGWVTLASEADVVDLAGLTDPAIAALPGGHTSKRVDGALLLGRHPDVVLLYTTSGSEETLAEWRAWLYPRWVEESLAADDRLAARAHPLAYLPLGTAGYAVIAVTP
jgi:hypothetical protein